eukprot:TRINITY_DN3324_c0_g1_i12.p1 TRINITY_DN3324_c0_g1~~TRINITY_DN3324_c0_g1_i12.p1  ORF type:complete len:452 (-),score=152.21 TRINITY_DN3324_c0_g1_i12:528-1838(-)
MCISDRYMVSSGINAEYMGIIYWLMQLEAGENVCEVHVESKAFFYCTKPECKKFVCMQCVSTAHKDHPVYVTRFVNDSSKAKIIADFDEASRKKAKNLDTTEKLLSGSGTAIKSELEEIVFNSKYTTLLRQKVKEYEKRNAELIELNKQLTQVADKKKIESMDAQKKFDREMEAIKKEFNDLQKKYSDDTKKLRNDIKTIENNNEKKIIELNDEHREVLEKLTNEKAEVERQLNELNEYKQHKAKMEQELAQCKRDIDMMERNFQEERITLTNLHIKNVESLKTQQEANEFLEKNRARLMAQKDLAITEETHKRLVEELQDDRKTQKDEIERIKKKEDKLTRDYKEVVRDLELAQQQLEAKTIAQVALEKKIRQRDEELKMQKESLTQLVKDFEKEKQLMTHHYEGELNDLRHEIQCNFPITGSPYCAAKGAQQGV